MHRFKPAARPIAASVALLWIVFTGCRPVPPQYEKPLLDSGAAASHALHSDSLRVVMGTLQRLTDEELPQEVDPAAERRRRMAEMAALARQLTEAAADIPSVLDSVELGSDQEQLFLDLSSRLAAHATEMRRSAEAESLPDVKAAWQEVHATCSACHNAFRVLPVVPSP